MPATPEAIDSAPETDRGLRLVGIVAAHPHGITLADAARAAGLSASTALRRLRSLAVAGFAVHRDDGRWAPGPELLRIARQLAASVTLAELAQPVLVALAGTTGESAYLAEPVDDRDAVYVAMEPGRYAVRHVGWLGRTVPRQGTALGAALAGSVDADGAAQRDGGAEEGVTAISAPVRDRSGAIVAAVSIVGPTFRLAGRALAAHRAEVVQAAVQLGNPHVH
ncbi:MAG: IclR family transcriptional regulator C-terminal domain-containing protein [Actinomycetota bacterium]|nr:IclR family transcriptional regulator C-terminal domain-containing protein [Actinomycetota bacterium]